MPPTSRTILDDDAIAALVKFIRDLDDIDEIARLYTTFLTDDAITVQGPFAHSDIFQDGKLREPDREAPKA